MPQLDLTETEIKILWLYLDRGPKGWELSAAEQDVEIALFDKMYRAYRGYRPACPTCGMPPERAA